MFATPRGTALATATGADDDTGAGAEDFCCAPMRATFACATSSSEVAIADRLTAFSIFLRHSGHRLSALRTTSRQSLHSMCACGEHEVIAIGATPSLHMHT